MADIGKININNLSDGLYKKAVKLAKDNKLEQNINKLVDIASKDGFTTDEKDFLEGLASKDNVDKIKNSNSSIKTIDFVEPGFKNNTINGLKAGFSENAKQLEIRSSINASSEIDKLSKNVSKELLNEMKIKLPSQIDQKKFLEVLNIGNIDNSQIQNVLSSGVLSSKDKNGASIISNLHDMAFNKNQKVSDNKQLVRDAIKILQPNDAGRKEITQGDIHYTCGAASIQQFMKKFEPAELVRIVKDLAQKGESTLKGGQTIKAGTGSFNFRAGSTVNASEGDIKKYGKNGKVLEDRTGFDIMFQSAAMRNIALIGGDMTGQSTSPFSDLSILDAANVVDRDYNLESDSDYGGDLNVLRGNKGGHPGAISKFLGQVTGKKYDYEHSLDTKNKALNWLAEGELSLKGRQKDNSGLINQLKKSLSDGKDTVFVYGKDITSLHYVTGLRFGKNDKGEEGIFFVNTMSKNNNGKVDGSNTNDFMTLKDLKAKLQGVIFEK